MNRHLHTSLESLVAIAPQWDTLACGSPMRTHGWLAGWWRHYGDASRGELHVVAVTEGEQLIGLAPWRIEQTLHKGTTIRWLGDGEVCTDHATILTAPGSEQAVANTLADYLFDELTDWQLLELVDVDKDDPGVNRLADALAERSASVERQPAGSCWRLPLPDDWEAFLTMQSKSHRKQIRRSERLMERLGTFRWHAVNNLDDWQTAWPILVDLHQRRRQSLGEPGCFTSPRWSAFHEDVAQHLLQAGQLRLFWSELDGRPLTAEYLLAGPNAWQAYQTGLDPERLDVAPGRVSLLNFIQNAIDDSVGEIDFLRGDETYKPHWRATPHPTEHVRIVPPRVSAQLRNQATRVTRSVRGIAKRGLQAIGVRKSSAEHASSPVVLTEKSNDEGTH